MDADWDEVARFPLPPTGLGPHGAQAAVSSMIFDTSENLLWTGNGSGCVTSYYGTELRRYTSFKAHKTGAVHQLLVSGKGVVALGSNFVHMASRKGPPLWHIESPEFKDLRCMSLVSKGSTELLVAGWQDTMFVIDLAKGEITKRVPTESHYSIMKRSRYICAATKSGSVHLLDPSSLAVVKTWLAHSAMINNMDAQHDFIVTCGYSLRGGQNYMLDPFLNVFDMKKMSSTPPIPFPAGAAFVRMHPRMSTTSIVVSQQGQMHVLDLVNPNTSNVRQVNVLGFLSMFDIAPSGEALALADLEGIQLWGSPSKVRFVDYPTPTHFADPVELPQIDWTVNTPLNSIGMPYYRETLLSAWPPSISDVGAPPVKFEPQFLDTLTHADFGLYGQNTRGMRRNQVEKTRKSERTTTKGIQAPKFLSEKARESAKASSGSAGLDDKTDDIATNFANAPSSDVPVMYRNVEIKYSKFGVDDFDFGYYNKTPYSGLEIHIANSYANPLLQLLHFTPLIRNLALHHTSTSCVDESCLLCEMGFLFDMLQKAEGSICQATNMLKTLSNHPQAGPLGLLEEDPHGSSYATMLQGLTRFLFDKMVQDYRQVPPKKNMITLQQVLETEATSHIRCTKCGNEYTRPGSTFVNDLIYPPTPKILTRNQKFTKPSFSQILKASIERETTAKGWCNRCQRYQNLSTRKTITQSPSVLMLNTSIRETDQSQLWCTPGWLPDEIGVIVDQGQFFCYEGEDLKLHLQRGFHNIQVYSLVGVAMNVAGAQGQNPHLVAAIDVGHSETTPPTNSQWHLFNDFLVQPISKDEAVNFASWKMPCVVGFQLKEANNKMDFSWKDTLDTSLLYRGPSPSSTEFNLARVLNASTENPSANTIVALDTEFVAVRQPEIEVNSDGERETIRPIVYALARVSVVRGQGEDEGLPFIDDYISVKEPIVDYLTSYSGITRADLDPRLSKRNLVSLKVAYKKLWILLNLGCRFLGHGLKQDFRVINIHIPRAQVVDTIDLFFLRSRLRKLSLAFLAWCLLKEDIQLETHDSIEDARTALKLYRKFLEFQDAGILETMLQDIYRTGREVNFKPPRRDGQDVQRMETPPLPPAGGAAPTTPSKSGLGADRTGAGGVGFGVRSGWTPGKGSPFR